MSWFRVDDHLHAHSKAVRAGTEAMGLWILAGSWAAAEESDGWVPGYMLARLAGAGADDLAERLVRAGLWEHAERDGDAGYVFHQWEEHQPTRAQLEAKREAARERMRAARSQGGKGSGSVRANTEGTAREVRSTRPDPTRPDNTTTADAADHDGFASWWEGYPRKTGKAAAAKAYAKARKSATADELMAGLVNACAVWTADRTEARFIPHPATWLNQGRWEDEQPCLPGSPELVRPATLRQCDGTGCPGGRHTWTDARNHYLCQGA